MNRSDATCQTRLKRLMTGSRNEANQRGWRSSSASPQQTVTGGSSLVPRESTPANREPTPATSEHYEQPITGRDLRRAAAFAAGATVFSGTEVDANSVAQESYPLTRSIPRVRRAYLPTPPRELPRLSKLLNGPRLLVKRGDQTRLATGGNKARKLEFLSTAVQTARPWPRRVPAGSSRFAALR